MLSFLHSPVPPWLSVSREGQNFRVVAKLAVFGDLGRAEVSIKHRSAGDEEPLRMGEEEGAADLTFTREFQECSPRLAYYFQIYDGNRLLYFSRLGVTTTVPLNCFHFSVDLEESPAAWAADQIFYQIFPDRYHAREVRQELKNDAESGKVRLMDWSYSPARRPDAGHCLEYTGGTLDGIIEKLDHIQGLGCTALYLNPFQQAPSNHRYNTEDYLRVDPYLGSNDDMARLSHALRERGMRLVGDAVINHAGSTSRWFQNARNNPHSEERQFFDFDSSGTARLWCGVESLPALNYSSRALRQKIFECEDSALQFWLRPPYSMNGWRFDVSQNVGRSAAEDFSDEIWRGVNQACRRAMADAYLFGENVYDASDVVARGKLDGAMNYRGFYFPAIRWLLRQSYQWSESKSEPEYLPTPEFGSRDFIEEVQQALSPYTLETQLLMFNFINNHDMPRFISLSGGNRALNKLAYTLLLTFAGVPSIYYGDETGLDGMFDPENRKPMIWDQSRWDNDIYNHLRAMTALRAGHISLRRGAAYFIPQNNQDLLCYFRLHQDERVLVILNRSDKSQRLLRTSHPYFGRGLKIMHSIGGIMREKSFELGPCGDIIALME